MEGSPRRFSLFRNNCRAFSELLSVNHFQSSNVRHLDSKHETFMCKFPRVSPSRTEQVPINLQNPESQLSLWSRRTPPHLELPSQRLCPASVFIFTHPSGGRIQWGGVVGTSELVSSCIPES
ncbi:hypothetical protein V6N13_043241 [Hibiscus sabdariffa]